MAGLVDLARSSTPLDEDEIEHLQRLVSSWSLLSDLALSDLLLFAPVDLEGTAFVVVGHTRSVTAPTVHPSDPVGTVVTAAERPPLAAAYLERRRAAGLVPRAGAPAPPSDDPTVHEDIALPGIGGGVTVDYVPVVRGDTVLGVLTRESDPGLLRIPSPVERRYRSVWERFADMVASGSFPLVRSERVGEQREPRAGDGLVLLDRERRIEYASPNAVSALHRLGVVANVEGRTLSELGVEESALRRAFSSRHSTVEVLEQPDAVAVIARCHPLIEDGRVTGAALLLRDITELRNRDKLLVSKDATIREIHHRVKNNLQTIQSLLRLQARRLQSAEAVSAVEQSARRIGSIAIVHELLSGDTADVVDFDSVVQQVMQMLAEGLSSVERPVRVHIEGGLGELAGDVAMPLAVVLTELLQNAIDHAGSDDPVVVVRLERGSAALELRVEDRGPGVPDGFALDRDAGLGLTIVRTFVVHDLGGSVSLRRARLEDPPGTVVVVRVPRRGPGLTIG